MNIICTAFAIGVALCDSAATVHAIEQDARVGLHSDAVHRHQALEDFFKSMDSDGDGQIQKQEASQYISSHSEVPDGERQSDGSVAREAEQAIASLDGSDIDDTISIEELESNLDERLQVRCTAKLCPTESHCRKLAFATAHPDQHTTI
jgi:hypothetical protein